MSISYSLDSISTIFPALKNYVYRFGAKMKEPIQKDILEKALSFLVPYYPILFTHLKETPTGYVHVPATDLNIVKIGLKPIQTPPILHTEKPMFRIYIENDKIDIDFFHGVGDGNIATRFFLSLLDAYCALLDGKSLPKLHEPEPSLLKDPYPLYARKGKSSALTEKESYVLHLNTGKKHYESLKTFLLSVEDLRRKTKPIHRSINDFLCAVLYRAIFTATDAKDSDKPITLSASIDLRPFYHCDSHRNFSYFHNIRLGRENHGDVGLAMNEFHDQIHKAATIENLNAGVASVNMLNQNPLVKYAPRALKDSVIRLVYQKIAEEGITTTLSNVGYKKLSALSKEHVLYLDGFLDTKPSKINVLAIGSNDVVALCVHNRSKDCRIEKALEDIFKEYAIGFKINETTFEW